MKSDFSPSRRAWNVIMTAVVWAAAVLVIALTVGVIGLVLVRGIPHISWEFLSTTASVLKGTDGILPAILNTFYFKTDTLKDHFCDLRIQIIVLCQKDILSFKYFITGFWIFSRSFCIIAFIRYPVF